MCEEHCLRVNVQARELCPQVHARLLPVGHVVGPIEELHRFGVVAVGRMFREGVVESRVDQEVAEAGMVYPVNQHGEIARRVVAVRWRSGLLG